MYLEDVDASPASFRILLVGLHQETVAWIRDSLGPDSFRTEVVESLPFAEQSAKQNPFAVVVAEQTEHGEGWKALLQQIRRWSDPPAFLLLSETANPTLWVEALSLGGFDLLPAMSDSKITALTLRNAVHHWKRTVDVRQARQENPFGHEKIGKSYVA
jgi:DNA-binding NtrC family response regulator